MGTTLTGTTPQDTYDSLIKVTDNGPLSATAKYLSDGLGNDSVLALSTAAVGIGTTSGTSKANILSATVAQTVLTIEGNYAGSGSVELLEFNRSGGAVSGAIKYQDADTAMAIGTTTSHAFLFNTGDTEKMRITSAGNVGIGTSAPVSKLSVSDGTNAFHVSHNADGPYISGANNAFTVYKKLSYDATDHLFFSSSAERFRITNNGVTFNGDTAAANALDDYEEGTWTMGVSFGGASVGVTTSNTTGTYTKIGRQVTVNGWLVLTSKGSSTGTAKITGLPFTIAFSQANYAGASFRMSDISFANQFQGYGGIGGTTIELEEITEAGAVTVLTNADFANNSGIMVSFTYFV